jgi:coproporphyrinogen III oxidase
MSRYVSDELRHFVASRAGNVCEYCLIYEHDTFFGCEFVGRYPPVWLSDLWIL